MHVGMYSCDIDSHAMATKDKSVEATNVWGVKDLHQNASLIEEKRSIGPRHEL